MLICRQDVITLIIEAASRSSARGCVAPTAVKRVSLATYAHFADRDPLTKVVLEQMLAGVSTRLVLAHARAGRSRHGRRRALDVEVGGQPREFVGRTGVHLRALISRSLADVRLAALMLDGIDLKGRCCVVCLGLSTDTPDFVFERGPIGVLPEAPSRRALSSFRGVVLLHPLSGDCRCGSGGKGPAIDCFRAGRRVCHEDTGGHRGNEADEGAGGSRVGGCGCVSAPASGGAERVRAAGGRNRPTCLVDGAGTTPGRPAAGAALARIHRSGGWGELRSGVEGWQRASVVRELRGSRRWGSWRSGGARPWRLGVFGRSATRAGLGETGGVVVGERVAPSGGARERADAVQRADVVPVPGPAGGECVSSLGRGAAAGREPALQQRVRALAPRWSAVSALDRWSAGWMGAASQKWRSSRFAGWCICASW